MKQHKPLNEGMSINFPHTPEFDTVFDQGLGSKNKVLDPEKVLYTIHQILHSNGGKPCNAQVSACVCAAVHHCAQSYREGLPLCLCTLNPLGGMQRMRTIHNIQPGGYVSKCKSVLDVFILYIPPSGCLKVHEHDLVWSTGALH